MFEKKEKIGIGLLVLLILFALTFFVFQQAIPQDPSYHLFKDTRSLCRIPHFWNVCSNFPFLIVGLLGLYSLKNQKLQVIKEFKIAYFLFFLGVFFVAFGSAYYHLWPTNLTLVWDRLPMTLAFMALFSILIAEFIHVRLGKALLFPFVLLGIASVLYWNYTEKQGQGDLRFYALVQFFPILCIPILLLFFRSRYQPTYAYWGLLLLYGIAKFCESFDQEIFEFLGEQMSGHSLKHLFAALGIFLLWKAYQQRSEVELSFERL
jgi:hypothetical protein